eukprot:TRINITY_DN61788_c0_g1_i1.p1 TRINITY_DN61788_c0_g1~~TRINITY_DN61788_c0_g1_i1.p1  ORF type:complete len:175 (-),score=26.05 TRINITY_DN61788_c0_g1_i1:102-626(-)
MKGGEGCWDMQKKGSCPRTSCKWCAGCGGAGGGAGGWNGKSGGIVLPGKGCAGGGGGGYSAKGNGVWTPGWKKGGGNNYGSGKGKSRNSPMSNVHPSLKVWIGNLPRTVTRESLQMHMNQASLVKSVEVDRGSGAAEYASEAEVAHAIALLNGSFIEGSQIQVDEWKTKKVPMM